MNVWEKKAKDVVQGSLRSVGKSLGLSVSKSFFPYRLGGPLKLDLTMEKV